ncbi:asparagine synthase (glutamine-hydrolyzing) [Palleronia sp. KMU-117]|uniref:asparagine synthase (glutamine-hydrolyzing) n=1 Tax=Palleronia sp. KMU-117 TaxID=3434108 RepID=UPI003D70AA2B
MAIFGLPEDAAIKAWHVDAARDLMAQRGPDASATLEDRDAAGRTLFLAHRRLSIQDLSLAADQPMTSASGRCSIVYNGEVYNTASLRQALRQHGVDCRTTSDTELILEGYELWGPAVVDRLNGMFAFAIWDRHANTAFLARDRIGVKPLYVAQVGGVLACASDARALRALGFGNGIDREALALYLMLGYVPAPRAIHAGIEKLDAGTTLRWAADGRVSQHTYWSAPTDSDYEGARVPLADLVDTVVEEHLLSDVPLGLFLSGGIDSSVIAASIAGLGPDLARNVSALTVAYPGQAASDEAPVARRTAEALGLRLTELPLTSASDHGYDMASASLDEPLAYNAIVSQSAISQLAAQTGLKCVISGDGGDEVFGGYRWYDPADLADFAPQRAAGLRGYLKSFSPRKKRAFRDAARGQAFRGISDLTLHAFRLFPALRPDHVAALMGDLTEARCTELLQDALSRHDAPRLDWKRRMQRIDLYTFCQDVVLPKVDRAGMAYSVEARPPLLDHRVIEWGLSHPVTDDFDGVPKAPLRAILRDRGLGFLLDEPKRGFSLKLGTGPDARQVRDTISGAMQPLGLRPDWEAIVHEQVEKRVYKLDTLLFLALWQAQGTAPLPGLLKT